MHKVGWHLGNTVPISSDSWKIMSYVPPAAICFITGEHVGSDELKRILDISPGCHIIYRPYFAPSDKVLDYQGYINAVCSMIDENNESFWGFVPEAQRHLQVWNEQNMPWWSQWEGFGDTAEDMVRFNDWFCKAYAQLKAANPTFRIQQSDSIAAVPICRKEILAKQPTSSNPCPNGVSPTQLTTWAKPILRWENTRKQTLPTGAS